MWIKLLIIDKNKYNIIIIGIDQKNKVANIPTEIVKKIYLSRFPFHLYPLNATKRRDALIAFLIKNNIDAKIHYPKPIHLQPAAKFLKHKKGDFPKAEEIASTTFSLPVHEFITKEQIRFTAEKIKSFYKNSSR